MEAKIRKAGIFIPPKPVDVINQNNLFNEWEQLKRKFGGISGIPFELLGEFLDRWTQMISYTRYAEAIADVDCSTARELRDTVKKQLYVIKDGSRELRDAKVYADDIYITLEKDYTEKYALYVVIKALREGYEQRSNAISREITRRLNEVNDQKRSMNRNQGGCFNG